MKRTCLLALVCVLFFAAVSRADYDYVGSLNYEKDVLTFEFTVEEARYVTFFTSVWEDYGIDLLLTLWDAAGYYLGQYDDANDTFYYTSGGTYYLVGEYDVFHQDRFAAQKYYATLTVGGNWANGSHLSQGFAFDDDPPIGGSGDEPYGYVSFHILGASSVRFLGDETEVPEPGVLAILGLGLAALPFVRKRKS